MIFKVNGSTIAVIDNLPRGLRKDYIEQYARDKFQEHINLIDVEQVDYDKDGHTINFIGEMKNQNTNNDWLI